MAGGRKHYRVEARRAEEQALEHYRDDRSSTIWLYIMLFISVCQLFSSAFKLVSLIIEKKHS